jgi:hypothetical protein
MRKCGLAEWMLQRAAGAERGTAMYGDLVEMGTTRGDAWFWIAYTRAVIALTWRMVAGFVLALGVVVVVNRLEFGNEWQKFVFFHFPHRWRRIPYGRRGLPLYNLVYTALSAASTTGCLLTAYAAVRYGLRDRMVRAALALGLLLTIAMSLSTEWPLALSLVALAAATMGCAMLMRQWRGAFAVTVASMVAGTVMTWSFYSLERWMLMHSLRLFSRFPHHPLLLGYVLDFWAVLSLDLIVTAYVAARVRRLLAQQRIAA